MDKLSGETFDIVADNVDKLKELFPEAFKEGKIDFAMLRQSLGDNVETEKERYNFNWHGKSDAIKMSLKKTTGTLKPCKEESKDWDTTKNLFIEGDNLEVLRVMQDTYRNKVKMIYIDPPYNTGKDFVYKDNFKDNIANYKEQTDQSLVSNPESSGRYHTNWLNMMYPRLKLAKNLLKDDGVIFISIDDNEVSNLRKVCDEIFGEENFIVNFIWEKHKAPKNDNRYVTENHEYILMFSKSREKFKLKKLPRSKKNIESFINPDNDLRGSWISGPLLAPTYSQKSVFGIIKPNGNEVFPPNGKCWSFSRERIKELTEDNRIWFGEDGRNVPRIKRFLLELSDGIGPTSMLLHDELSGTQKASNQLKKIFDNQKIFTYPKPLEIIERFLRISVDKNDVILDFFAGSATTAHAVMQMNAKDGGNRKCTSVQLPELTDEKSEAYKAGYKNIADIGKERIRRAGKKIKEENKDKEGIDKLDIGFKVFKLDSTNLKQWDETTKDIQESLLDSIDPVKEGRSQEDLMYEILLKYGVDLAVPIEEKEIKGKKVFSVADNYLIVCLEKDLGLDLIEEIGKLKPKRVVFYDEGFKDDNVKVNAQQILKKYKIEDIRVI